MFKIFVTSSVPDEILKKLEQNFELNYHNSEKTLSEEELMRGVADADAILCPLSDKITKNVIDAGKNLKIIANYGAGFDNIDVKYAAEKKIVVTNAPASNSSTSTAELTAGLIVAAARKIVSGDKLTRKGGFHGWKPNFYLGYQLREKTLGIIGMGNIGKKLSQIMKNGFGMQVLYWNRTRLSEDLEKELGVTYSSIEEMLPKVDVLSIHTAFAPELKHIIDYDKMTKMKKDAILVNAARGPLVSEQDLLRVLEEGRFFAVGLDVYEFEPKYDKKLEEYERVILCPHLGNATFEARVEMGNNAFENLLAFKEGRACPNQVNKF